MTKTASARQASTQGRPAPLAQPVTTISLAIAAATCADARTMRSVAARSDLDPVDTHTLRQGTREHLAALGALLQPGAGERATQRALHRLVATFVANACTSGRFYNDAMSRSHSASARVIASGGDPSPSLASAALRLSRAADEAALASHAMLALAEGAAAGYTDLTGLTWLPEVRDAEAPGISTIQRRSA